MRLPKELQDCAEELEKESLNRIHDLEYQLRRNDDANTLLRKELMTQQSSVKLWWPNFRKYQGSHLEELLVERLRQVQAATEVATKGTVQAAVQGLAASSDVPLPIAKRLVAKRSSTAGSSLEQARPERPLEALALADDVPGGVSPRSRAVERRSTDLQSPEVDEIATAPPKRSRGFSFSDAVGGATQARVSSAAFIPKDFQHVILAVPEEGRATIASVLQRLLADDHIKDHAEYDDLEEEVKEQEEQIALLTARVAELEAAEQAYAASRAMG